MPADSPKSRPVAPCRPTRRRRRRWRRGRVADGHLPANDLERLEHHPARTERRDALRLECLLVRHHYLPGLPRHVLKVRRVHVQREHARLPSHTVQHRKSSPSFSAPPFPAAPTLPPGTSTAATHARRASPVRPGHYQRCHPAAHRTCRGPGSHRRQAQASRIRREQLRLRGNAIRLAMPCIFMFASNGKMPFMSYGRASCAIMSIRHPARAEEPHL